MSFRDTAKVLRIDARGCRVDATGCGMGAYEYALAYAQKREQFGKPIGSFFQLVQGSPREDARQRNGVAMYGSATFSNAG